MLKIPKLAQGGIIKDNLSLICLGEKGESIFEDKYYQIHKHTKKKRIKKKQEKKSLFLTMQKNIKQVMKE